MNRRGGQARRCDREYLESKCSNVRRALLSRSILRQSLLREKPPDPQTNLEGVDARIEVGQSGVGDVHVARLDAPAVPGSEQMDAKHTAARKVHGVRGPWNVVVVDQRSPT